MKGDYYDGAPVESCKETVLQPEAFAYATPMSKNFQSWPFVIVLFGGLAASFGYIFSQLQEFRYGVRYQMYLLLGTRYENGEWIGGHREVAEFLFNFYTIGLPTLIAGIALAFADALPPVPKGMYRSVVRFMKKKILNQFCKASYAEAIIALCFLGMNAIWLTANYSERMQKAKAEGEVLKGYEVLSTIGYVFGFNAMLCFSVLLLPATRNCFWMISMGIDYAHGIKYHRILGVVTIVMIMCHALPYYKTWLSEGKFIRESFPCFSCEVEESKHRLQNFAGQIALLSCIIIGCTSMPAIRRRYYEVFYYAHHLFILVFICGALHFSSFIIWMHPAVCLYVMHRILSSSQSRVAAEIVEMDAVPGEITRLVFRRSPGKAGHYHAGQFVYLRIPMLSRNQWHPFSISSSPIEYEDTFTVHVKALGIWTKTLYGLAIQSHEEGKLPLIYVDGFYGKMSDDFQHYPTLVFIAGGIGATPIISILGKILDCLRTKDPVFADTKIYFHWTSREIGIFHEFEPLLDAIEQYDPRHEKIKVRLCFTGDQHLGGVDIPLGIVLKPLDDTSGIPTRPFHQSSRSVSRQMLLFFLTFVTSFICLLYTRMGYPFLGKDREKQHMWPVQRLMEVVMMLLGAGTGWIIAVTERQPIALSLVEKSKLVPQDLNMSARTCAKGDFESSFYSHTLSMAGEEIHFKHPISRTRLNVKELLSEVVAEQSHIHDLRETGIGLWVSGPMGLMHTVQTESEQYGGIYDVHYEEFLM